MKMLRIILLAVLFTALQAKAQNHEHVQNIHKYITQQAWELVKAQYPGVIHSEMNSRIGHWQDGNLNGTGPWQKGYVVTGAYREDEEDVVYGHQFPFTSATHFWDADAGDDAGFCPPPFLHTFENAYRKIQAYWTGKEDGRDWLEMGPFFYNFIPYLIRVKYDSLHNAYKDHNRFIVTHWMDIATGVWFREEPPMAMIPFLIKNSNNYSHAQGSALAKRICWEIVGRICHLIEDCGVPAHAHNDEHIFGDYFEEYMHGAYSQYNWQDALDQGGIININWKNFPLRYALYTTNQIADRFSSDDEYGDANIIFASQYNSENYYQDINPAYASITLAGVPVNAPPHYHAPVAANILFVYTIRSVAGFLWYVYNQFGITSDVPPQITGFDYSLPDQHIYNGETLEIRCNATGTNLNYDWVVRGCDTTNLCNRNVPGLTISTSENVIRIRNDYFYNHWTCTRYDSLCSNGGSRLLEDPMHLYVGVSVSNSAGSVRRYYDLSRLISINPNQHLRPGPFSGCPFLLSNNGSGFVYENNILHKSEFAENKDKDITDILVMNNSPFINTEDSTIGIALNENSIDHSYIDQIELLSVDHPAGTLVSVTNDGEIITIAEHEVISPVIAEHSGKEVTDILQYDTVYGKTVYGFAKDNLFAKFPDGPQSSGFNALIFDASPPPNPVIPVVKDVAGEIVLTDFDGNSSSEPINFAVRQNRSQIVVPIEQNKKIHLAEMKWQREFGSTYFAIAPVSYTGFQTTELPLISAMDLKSGNVLAELQNDDKVYAQLDSSTHIALKFKAFTYSPSQGQKRTYLVRCTGRYSKPADYIYSKSAMREIRDEMTSVEEPELFPNFPNPFNPVTRLEIYLPATDNAELVVTDITGRTVATIHSGKLDKGKHSFEFDGSSVSSGAYFLRLKYQSKTIIRKMLLVK